MYLIKVVKGDITKIDFVEAIVNVANKTLIVCNRIYFKKRKYLFIN